MDNGSTDDTAEIARRSGARVVSAEDVAAELGPALGKGDVLWRSLQVASGDIVVWLDGDLSLFTPRHVTSLVSPLLEDDRVVLVRAIQDAYEDRMRATDGHVADLTARPALKLLFPELAHIRQPLGGEQAVRRANVLALPFEVDEGGSVGLLIDVSRRFGPQSIRQVDLGARRLRIRPLEEAYEHARQVLRAILSRAHGESMTSGSIQRPAGASWLAIAHNKVALPERERTVTRKVSGTGPLRLRLHFSVVAGHERKDEGLWHGETLA